MNIARRLAGRALLALLTLVVISVVTFAATSVIPGNPARVALGKFATPEQLEAYREQQHLDDPVVDRFLAWSSDFVRGDWGNSLQTRQPVKDEVLPRLWRTLILALSAMAIAVAFAYALGVYAALRSGKSVDVAVSVSALVVNSLPEFVVGLLVLIVLGVWLGVLPVESSAAALDSGLDAAYAYVLPVLTLAIVLTPYIARMVRVNVRETLSQPFVRSAVLRGVPRRRVLWQHVVPNASLPVVNVIALSLAELVGGVVVIESVFGFPGVGKLLVDSVGGQDLPTVQALALVIGLGFITLNLLADSIVLALNPRARRA
jgi:peptide/nickel transport system permease protein